MAQVTITPLPREFLKVPSRLWPQLPPVFVGEPAMEDRLLALELWRALDVESRRWYAGTAREFVGLPLTAHDIASLQGLNPP